MAYLVRDARSRSPYWYGVYLVVSPGGQRQWVRKSTKMRKRSEAKEILDAWQKTADRAAAGNLDQEQTLHAFGAGDGPPGCGVNLALARQSRRHTSVKARCSSGSPRYLLETCHLTAVKVIF
jgi:hypothetical protein